MNTISLRGQYDLPIYHALVRGPVAFKMFRNANLNYDPDGTKSGSFSFTYYTPLIVACMRKDTSSALILLNDGANANIADPQGMTAFLWSIQNGLVQVFLACLADPNINIRQTSKSGWGPLHFAVFYNQYEIAEALKKNEILPFDIDEGSVGEDTPRSLVKNPKMNKIING